jgi:hypothetical protein
MQNLALKSMVMLWESCSTLYKIKLSLQFSDFSTIFYEVYKIQPKSLYYSRFLLQRGPWNFSFYCRQDLGLYETP